LLSYIMWTEYDLNRQVKLGVIDKLSEEDIRELAAINRRFRHALIQTSWVRIKQETGVLLGNLRLGNVRRGIKRFWWHIRKTHGGYEE